MKKVMAVAIGTVVFALSACGKNSANPPQSASPAGPLPTTASAPPVASLSNGSSAPGSAVQQDSHNYQMVDNGTYGYEPALSEDDIRSGKATKALIMMRYEGNRNGAYTILILGKDPQNAQFVERVSCSSPCQFAKNEALNGDSVMSTETVPVAPNSLMGAMLQDAVSGQLVPYGQSHGDRIVMPTSPAAVPQAAPNANGTLQMFVGARDTNLRSCAGTGCAALIVIPKGSSVSVDMSSVQKTPQSSSTWVQVIYAGPYCLPSSIDPKIGCVAPVPGSGPVSGWLNYSLLSQSPQMAGAVPAPPDASPPDQSGLIFQTSFDCSKANSVPDSLICHDADLAALDRALAPLFDQAKAAATDKSAFADRMRKQWNYREKTCRDKACLSAWYTYEQTTLAKVAQTGDANAQ